ncbi:transglutaminase domain-containing protein [Spirochaeta isovalerica]|uniref:Transglutaminase-like putative cysteine protease n=1 Tax=Spirochaeta isovalerica TaxID=150 RepID=A0A841R6M9_9SPIO|nr:transglutaminase domain-containing protein [Spirochaeta isovalerica]MBB6478428.1 transglutaminase-like putative cysteine protease [Spirochaeta isovalerica]
MNRKVTLLAAGIPALMFILSLIAFVINTRIAEGKPRIIEMTPHTVSRGEQLTISGRNFGEAKDSSRIFLSSLDLLSRYIDSWNDREIVITIPEKANSGLLTIRTDRGLSKPAVIVLEENIPAIGAGSYIPGHPFIEYIDSPSGASGDIISITGEHFGDKKNNSEILFSSLFSHEVDSLDGETEYRDFLSVEDVQILTWEDKLIRFYLPDFVQTGDVYVRTERGYSNAAYFEQKLENSSLILSDKKTYMIHQSLSISAEFQNRDSKINYWFISPVETLFQRNVIDLPDRSFKSLYEHPGQTLYSIEGYTGLHDIVLSQNSIVEVYSKNSVVDPAEIGRNYDSTSPLFLKYTGSSQFITASSPRVSTVARSVTRGKSTAYDKSRAIYEYVIARLTPDPDAGIWDPDTVIDEMKGDSRAYSLLFTSLCRNSGIPARPVTGLLVDDRGNPINHWWAEFYLQGFGWFPVDPALADRNSEPDEEKIPIENYWGKIDNQHIVFSRGELILPRLFPEGKTGVDIDHAFVSHNYEVSSTINNLHLNWSDVRITAIY